MMNASHRLDDSGMRDFVIYGYLTLNPTLPAAVNDQIDDDSELLVSEKKLLGNHVYEQVPALTQIFEHPQAKGVLQSLLGDDMVKHPHRHCHIRKPGIHGGQWHLDDINMRHHQVCRLLVMYFPHTVTQELAPTIILPDTHLRNALTSRMATYQLSWPEGPDRCRWDRGCDALRSLAYRFTTSRSS